MKARSGFAARALRSELSSTGWNLISQRRRARRDIFLYFACFEPLRTKTQHNDWFKHTGTRDQDTGFQPKACWNDALKECLYVDKVIPAKAGIQRLRFSGNSTPEVNETKNLPQVPLASFAPLRE